MKTSECVHSARQPLHMGRPPGVTHTLQGACRLCCDLMVSGGECRYEVGASVEESKEGLTALWLPVGGGLGTTWGQCTFFVIRRKQDKAEGMYVLISQRQLSLSQAQTLSESRKNPAQNGESRRQQDQRKERAGKSVRPRTSLEPRLLPYLSFTWNSQAQELSFLLSTSVGFLGFLLFCN